MTTRSLIALLVTGTLLNACDSGGTDDALVGAWIRMRTATEMRDRYVFGADGSFAFDENKPDDPQTEDHLKGTYVARNGVVTATATNTLVPNRARLTFSYYANATQFSSAALRTAAPHNGIVGTWTGLRKLEILDASGQGPSGDAIDAEFRSDGTYRWTLTPFDGAAATVEMIMEKNVLTVKPQTRASRAAALLEKHKFGCLPVVERGRLVGIITEADFVRFARRLLEREAKSAAAA